MLVAALENPGSQGRHEGRMILTGPAIIAAVEQGQIEIDPYDPEFINPASYDLRLGDRVAVYTPDEHSLDISNNRTLGSEKRMLDSRLPQNCTTFNLSKSGFLIEPGRLYLMHTMERIHTKRFVPIIDGKSSIGRLGVFVHVTAGYGDPGFDGQYTLEVGTIAHPVIVYPGMRFAQVRFHMTQPTPDLYYRGSYQGDAAIGPVRSASWRQFVRSGKSDK